MLNMHKINKLDDDSIINFIDIKKGENVIDIGGRDGFFARKILRFTDKVTVLDVNNAYFDQLEKEGIKTINADICSYSKGKYDLVFMSNVYHDIMQECKDAVTNIEKLARNRIVILDFKPDGATFGPPKNIRITREKVIEDMEKINFEIQKELDLPYHYLLVFKRAN